jgi:hypothetical protein
MSYGSTGCVESGQRGCHSRREEASRDAEVSASGDDATGAGTGTLLHGLGMDITPPHVAGSAY